ncbi:DNA/RNA non-specific endonuclease [Listeria booriae]|uniref:DNA/RNA non-specific endonuclease n=1 Tax=Listeria booriae TaxID=1552123 RepID=A0A842F4J0_9LIST|nr:DNA/RNA non-specific endonuclease [Listeria booriae]MBC2242265.1 DNA/RNA non-specific endonuclease [Listeria booriae]
MKKKTLTTIIAILVILGVYTAKEFNINGSALMEIVPGLSNEQKASANTDQDLLKLQYDGKHQVVILNNNKPDFTAEEVKSGQKSGQSFSNLDGLNRVGPANAVLSRSLMPKEEREPLYVDPTGWKNKKIPSGWLYNRSHLIGYQMTGENNNLKNLMTGTRSLNSPSMLDYENQVAEYLKKTGNQVRYRVTPIFSGNDLLARGVQIEAQSIQDNGLSFNVYIFNVEKGVVLDYSDGSSKLAK